MLNFFSFFKSIRKNVIVLCLIFLLFGISPLFFDIILHNITNYNHTINLYQLNEYYILQKVYFAYLVVIVIFVSLKYIAMKNNVNRDNFFSSFMILVIISELVFFVLFYHQLDNITYDIFNNHTNSFLSSLLSNNNKISNSSMLNFSINGTFKNVSIDLNNLKYRGV